MPKIPIYERQIERAQQGSMSYSLPGERVSPLNIPSDNPKWSGVQDFAERVTKIGERLRNAANTEALSNATVATADGLSRIVTGISEDQALIDAAPEEYERVYLERSAELKKSISGRIKDVATQSKFNSTFEDRALDGRVKIRALGRDRMISRGRASTDSQLDSLVNSFIRSGDPQALAEGGSIIAAKRASGFFTAQEAVDLGQKFARNATVGYWERRILDAPALAYEMLRKGSESLETLPEDDRTRLMAHAKHAAEQFDKDAALNTTYAELKQRFGNNLAGAVNHLVNPNNYKDLPLQQRNYLINSLEGEINFRQHQADRYRADMGRKERGEVLGLVNDGKIQEAIDRLGKAENIDPVSSERLESAIMRLPWKDNQLVVSKIDEAILGGDITDRDQIDDLRGHGLSNATADRAIRKLEKWQGRYREGLKYAEAKFKKVFPAKNEAEMHLQWGKAVSLISDELERVEDKGRAMPYKEQVEVIDNILDERVLQARSFWFDVKGRPIEYMIEGKPLPGTEKGQRPGATYTGRIDPVIYRQLPGLPRKVVDQAARILAERGFIPTAKNIEAFYLENAANFQPVKAGR